MKTTISLVVTFIFSFIVIYYVGGLLFNGQSEANRLQAAVTFNGINFLALFVYVVIAIIMTTIIYFSVIHKRLHPHSSK